MNPQSRMYYLVAAGLCSLGAAALSQVDGQAAGDASQALEDQALALLGDIAGDGGAAPAAAPPAQPPAPQPPAPQPAPGRPGQRVSRR